MMKQGIIILSILVCFLACNNNEQKQTIEPVVVTTTPEQAMKDSIAKFPDSILLRVKLAKLYRDTGDYDKAIITVNEILQKDSSNASLWDMKATLHFENEDTINAIKSFEKANQKMNDPIAELVDDPSQRF